LRKESGNALVGGTDLAQRVCRGRRSGERMGRKQAQVYKQARVCKQAQVHIQVHELGLAHRNILGIQEH